MKGRRPQVAKKYTASGRMRRGRPGQGGPLRDSATPIRLWWYVFASHEQRAPAFPRTQMPLRGDRLKLTTTLWETLSAQRDALWPSPTVSHIGDEKLRGYMPRS